VAAPLLLRPPSAPLPGWALYAAWATAIAAALVLAATGPWWAPLLVPGLILGVLLVTRAVRYPLLNLGLLLVLFALASRNEGGIGIAEVAFAAYYVPYLLCWYVTRLFVFREPLVQQRGDLAVLGLLGLALLGGVYGAVAGAHPSVLMGELGSFSLLAFYFPFREIAVRDRKGLNWLLGALVVLGVIAVSRNVFAFVQVLTSAPDLRGIAIARVVVNEVLIYFAATAALGGMLYLSRGTSMRRVAWHGAFLLCAVGVVLTQFRAFFLGLAVACAVAFLLTDGKRRLHLLAAAVFALVTMGAMAYAAIGDLFVVFMVGIFERTLSIGTASQDDISFINRFFEYERVWELIRERPLLGHGFGVEFGFYDAIDQATWTKAYVHNAYLHLWYKMGLVGLGIWCYVCALASWRGFWALRRGGDDVSRAAGVFVLCSLAGLSVAALASVLFNTDTIMPLAICLAVGAGLAHRRQTA